MYCKDVWNLNYALEYINTEIMNGTLKIFPL